MRGFKIFIYIGLFFFGIYALSMLMIDESKNFVIEKEINYPIDKVFPQFNNLQNFTQWNEFFVNKKGYKLSYYTPYEGQGSSMNYQNMKTKLNYNVVLEKKEEETPKNFALKQSILNGALADKMSSIQNPQSTSVAEPVKHQ